MKKISSLLLALMAATFASAADVAYTLMPPSEAIPVGSDARVDVAAMNPGALEEPFGAPISLAGKIITGAGEREVTLDSISVAPRAVTPGGFAVRQYHFHLPADVTGHVVLEVESSSFGTLRAVLDVKPAAAVAAGQPVPATSAPDTPMEKLHHSASVASGIARTFAGRFMPNQPIYFLYGGNADQAVKFQFSFDYKLATMRWGQPEAEKISTVRLGYTQRSLWDINGDSSPFYDTSYMPEIAFNTDYAAPKQHSWFTWMGWRTGFQHESNGKDGLDSRSLNTVYLRPRFILGDLDHWFAVMVPEVWGYVGDLNDNTRLKDYRGYGKLRFYIASNDGPTLSFAGWAGKDWNHFTYQLDLTWPLRLRFMNFESYLQAQYFNGYGESLRSYDQKGNALRFGIGLVR